MFHEKKIRKSKVFKTVPLLLLCYGRSLAPLKSVKKQSQSNTSQNIALQKASFSPCLYLFQEFFVTLDNENIDIRSIKDVYYSWFVCNYRCELIDSIFYLCLDQIKTTNKLKCKYESTINCANIYVQTL